MDAQSQKPIKLSKSVIKQGTIMDVFQNRRSDREFSSKELSTEEISNLLWASCGINRADGRRTSPTARNSQEIDVYLINKEGAYLYVPTDDLLFPVYEGDLRNYLAAGQEFVNSAPVVLLIVGDVGKMNGGENERNLKMMYCDGGIVSQSINLYCAANNLATVTRAMMDEKFLKDVLKLKDTQYLILNNPIGYKK